MEISDCDLEVYEDGTIVISSYMESVELDKKQQLQLFKFLGKQLDYNIEE